MYVQYYYAPYDGPTKKYTIIVQKIFGCIAALCNTKKLTGYLCIIPILKWMAYRWSYDSIELIG
jgi:hypothetical protein